MSGLFYLMARSNSDSNATLFSTYDETQQGHMKKHEARGTKHVSKSKNQNNDTDSDESPKKQRDVFF